MNLTQWLNPFIELVLPTLCFRCKKEGHWWCMENGTQPVWPICFWCRKADHTSPTDGCQRASLPLIIVGYYQEPLLRMAISQWKYDGHWQISRDWGRLIGESIKRIDRPTIGLVPVPLHWRRQLERGYNQAQILARDIRRTTGLPILDLLERQRMTRSQTQLTDLDRATNLKEAFRAKNPGAGEAVWILDDVVTTGSTMSEAIRTLQKANWQVTGVLAIALRHI